MVLLSRLPRGANALRLPGGANALLTRALLFLVGRLIRDDHRMIARSDVAKRTLLGRGDAGALLCRVARGLAPCAVCSFRAHVFFEQAGGNNFPRRDI